jgi:arabinofuranosyltransferase
MPRSIVRARARLAVAIGLTALYLAFVYRYAWVAEDAYITLRTVDNFVNGHGLRWNIVERVQAYTHPLWMLVVTCVYAFSREDFLTLICTGLATSALAFVALQRLARSTAQALFCGAVLILSPAYIDFSTAGLENPLAHLLLILFAAQLLTGSARRHATFRLTFLAALIMTNRLDHGLLVLPALLFQLVRVEQSWRQTLREVLLGLAPLLAWELFALVYYGFPFPNTAYAKLNTGIPSRELWRQGYFYLSDHVAADPLTSFAIVGGLGLAAVTAERELHLFAVGNVAYLLYLVAVGGDFMFGRFLTAPLIVSLIIAARFRASRRTELIVALLAAAALAVGIVSARAPWRSPLRPAPEPVQNRHGIADERSVYAAHSSLAARRGKPYYIEHIWADTGRFLRQYGQDQVVSENNVGFLGYFAGPRVLIVDRNALTDPLLARLPIEPGPWRVGHYPRQLPAGYLATLRSPAAGDNELVDVSTAQLYQRLARVTQGPIWSGRRFAAILRLNLFAIQPGGR